MNMKYLYFFTHLIIQIRLLFIIHPTISINSRLFKSSSSINFYLNKDMTNLFYSSQNNKKLGESGEGKSENTKTNTEEDVKYKMYGIFKDEFEYLLNKTKVSPECKTTLENNFLGKNQPNEKYRKDVYNYNIEKFFDDSSKHKNDLGTYAQCIYKKYKLNKNISNEFESVYVIFTLDKSHAVDETTNRLIYPKNTTEIEDIYYVRAFCLPQEPKKTTCSDADYLLFINEMNNEYGDFFGIKNDTSVFSLRNNEKYEDNAFIFYLKSIPLILALIQVILIVFRELIMKLCKKYYMYKNNKLMNKISPNKTLKKQQQNKQEEEDDNDDDEDKEDENNQTEIPNWLKIYNKCFNFYENFHELFNFSLNSTNINNDSGLSYIRGLKSCSLLLLILGLTYLTLMNSLSKILSKTLFYNFLNNPFFYDFFFIGLRYAPRIIFSCSGYTLVYKYLCFININSKSFSVLKFIFHQIHKYILLISFFIFGRYTFYRLYIFFSNSDSPMLKYLFKNILSRPEGPRCILSFFTLSSIYRIHNNSRYDQTLIEYFWLPYNEVFFFIIGVLIITIGYKFKLRIDIYLLILIALLYSANILYSSFKLSEEGEKYYATLYYYLFDYGKFMINPIFNLPCYLIGMYFGLINYTVQKGINTIFFEDIFKKKSLGNGINNGIELDLKSINSEDKNKEEENEDEDDIDYNKYKNNNNKKYNENDKENYRIEIIEMPFLISGVKISNWLRKNRVRLIRFLMIICIIFFITIHYVVLYNTIGKDYEEKKEVLEKLNLNEDNIDETPFQEVRKLLSLEKYISNTFINLIFRIDIEIMTFILQSFLFISYFKGQNFINDFYCHAFWAMLNKSYFSYILVANPIILFIFYQSETKIILNSFNLILYSLISGCLIFIVATCVYIFFELPYKRLIHYICSSNNEDKDDEQEDDKENKSENDEDD